MPMTHNMPVPHLIALCAAAMLSGCNPFAGPDEFDVVGVVRYPPNKPVQIDVPDTVSVGESFDVTVLSYLSIQGNLCIVGADRTDVAVHGLRADVTPYDHAIRLSPHEACVGTTDHQAHTAALHFGAPGSATITFHGTVDLPDRAAPHDTVIQRELVVR